MTHDFTAAYAVATCNTRTRIRRRQRRSHHNRSAAALHHKNISCPGQPSTKWTSIQYGCVYIHVDAWPQTLLQNIRTGSEARQSIQEGSFFRGTAAGTWSWPQIRWVSRLERSTARCTSRACPNVVHRDNRTTSQPHTFTTAHLHNFTKHSQAAQMSEVVSRWKQVKAVQGSSLRLLRAGMKFH